MLQGAGKRYVSAVHLPLFTSPIFSHSNLYFYPLNELARYERSLFSCLLCCNVTKTLLGQMLFHPPGQNMLSCFTLAQIKVRGLENVYNIFALSCLTLYIL